MLSKMKRGYCSAERNAGFNSSRTERYKDQSCNKPDCGITLNPHQRKRSVACTVDNGETDDSFVLSKDRVRYEGSEKRSDVDCEGEEMDLLSSRN